MLIFFNKNDEIYCMKKKQPVVSNKAQVTAHIKQLDPALGKIINSLRKIILQADPEVGERIKWNNPSFYYTGDMKPFDPKEYKREIMVMNLFKGRIMLVFPSGSKLNNQPGLLQGTYKDGRRVIVFKDAGDIKQHSDNLQFLIRDWISKVEK